MRRLCKWAEQDRLFLALALSWLRPPAGLSAFYAALWLQSAAEWRQLLAGAGSCCCSELTFPVLLCLHFTSLLFTLTVCL